MFFTQQPRAAHGGRRVTNFLVAAITATIAASFAPSSAGAASNQQSSSQDASPKISSVGSGFAVDSRGLYATAYHVVDDCSAIYLVRGGQYHRMRLVARNRSHDLAVLHGPAPAAFIGTIATQETTRNAGGRFITAGFAGKARVAQVATAAVVDRSTRHSNGTWMIDSYELSTSKPIQRGNSGGPVLNRSGEVIGVVSARSELMPHTGYAVPAHHLSGLVDQARGSVPAAATPGIYTASYAQKNSVRTQARRSTYRIACVD